MDDKSNVSAGSLPPDCPPALVGETLPTRIETLCACGACGYTHSWLEIFAGFLTKDKPHASAAAAATPEPALGSLPCLQCRTRLAPELLVELPVASSSSSSSAAAPGLLRVRLARPAQLLWRLRALQTLFPRAGGVALLRSDPGLFWNCMFYFASRGIVYIIYQDPTHAPPPRTPTPTHINTQTLP